MKKKILYLEWLKMLSIHRFTNRAAHVMCDTRYHVDLYTISNEMESILRKTCKFKDDVNFINDSYSLALTDTYGKIVYLVWFGVVDDDQIPSQDKKNMNYVLTEYMSTNDVDIYRKRYF